MWVLVRSPWVGPTPLTGDPSWDGIYGSCPFTPHRIPRSDRVTSTHGDMPARRRPAGTIPPRLLDPPTAGRLAERVEATHLCKEWLSCLGEMAGHGRNLMEVVYYCKRHVTMVAVPLLLAMTGVSGGDYH